MWGLTSVGCKSCGLGRGHKVYHTWWFLPCSLEKAQCSLAPPSPLTCVMFVKFLPNKQFRTVKKKNLTTGYKACPEKVQPLLIQWEQFVWHQCNLAAKESGLECARVNDDNFTVLVSGDSGHPLNEHVYCVAATFKMTEQVEQWVSIKFCIKLEHSSAETIQMVQKALGDDAMSAAQIKVWHSICWKWPTFWGACNKQNTWEHWKCTGCNQQRSATDSVRTRSWPGDSQTYGVWRFDQDLGGNILWQNLFSGFCYQRRRNIVLQLLMTSNRCQWTRFLQESHNFKALAGVPQWLGASLQIKGLPVQFPVRTHAWVAGQVPSRGACERQPHTDVFSLSISPSLPLS